MERCKLPHQGLGEPREPMLFASLASKKNMLSAAEVVIHLGA